MLTLLLACTPGSLVLPGTPTDTADSRPPADSWLGDTAVEQIPAADRHLPVLQIEVGGQTPWSEVAGTLRWVQPTSASLDDVEALPARLEVPISLEVHGSSSTGYPKLGYRLELRDAAGEDAEHPLLGLPQHSDWVLRAPYADKTLVRDALAYRLARSVSGEEGPWQPRTAFFELFLDGDYQGVYLLVERVRRDNDRVDIQRPAASAAEGDLSGGYIVRVDQHRNVGWDTAEGTPIDYHYPRDEEITAEQDAWLRAWFDRFEAALLAEGWDDPVSGYPSWLVVEEWVDHFILNELAHNIDAYRLSTYHYKDVDAVDPRLHAAPVWDFDRAYGNVNYCDAWKVRGFVIQSLTDCGYAYQYPFWWERLLSDPGFTQALRCRWEALRQELLADEALLAALDAEVAQLHEAEPRDHDRWPVLGEHVDPNHYVGDTYEDEVGWLQDWLLARADWLDGAMPGECP